MRRHLQVPRRTIVTGQTIRLALNASNTPRHRVQRRPAVGTGREEKYRIRKVFGTLPHDNHSLMLYQNIQGHFGERKNLAETRGHRGRTRGRHGQWGMDGPDHHVEVQTRYVRGVYPSQIIQSVDQDEG